MGKFSDFVFTENLRRERYIKKISLFEMAQKLGKKSPSSYMNIENGLVEPRLSDMLKVSEILNGSIENFFNLKLQETWSCEVDEKEEANSESVTNHEQRR